MKTIKLSREETRKFLRVMANPPKPTRVLREAFKRHQNSVTSTSKSLP